MMLRMTPSVARGAAEREGGREGGGHASSASRPRRLASRRVRVCVLYEVDTLQDVETWCVFCRMTSETAVCDVKEEGEERNTWETWETQERRALDNVGGVGGTRM